jgi:hypothetical protein
VQLAVSLGVPTPVASRRVVFVWGAGEVDAGAQPAANARKIDPVTPTAILMQCIHPSG